MKFQTPKYLNEYPKIILDSKKNTAINPASIPRSSKIKYWWRCRNGHEWLQSINSRANIKIKVECRFCKSPIK